MAKTSLHKHFCKNSQDLTAVDKLQEHVCKNEKASKSVCSVKVTKITMTALQ